MVRLHIFQRQTSIEIPLRKNRVGSLCNGTAIQALTKTCHNDEGAKPKSDRFAPIKAGSGIGEHDAQRQCQTHSQSNLQLRIAFEEQWAGEQNKRTAERAAESD